MAIERKQWLVYNLILVSIWSLILLISSISFAKAPTVRLKAGDRIVFFGDSITRAGTNQSGYVTLIRQALDRKYGALKIDVIGMGVNSNRVPDLQRRVDRDIAAWRPTIVVIYIGINDARTWEALPTGGTLPVAFESGLREVIAKCRNTGATVVLCTPSVIGERLHGTNTLDIRLDQYSEISRNLAKELNLPLCDLRKTFLDYIRTHNRHNAQRGILTYDRIHLNRAGNRLVADTTLKTLGH